MTIKKEDDVWYYKREDSSCNSSVDKEPITAEDELQDEDSDKEDRV